MESRVTLAVFISILLVSIGSAIWILRASGSWPSAEGVVLRSEVLPIRAPVLDGGAGGRSRIEYEALVEYEYAVDGVRHASTRLLAGLPSVVANECEALELVRRFPAGRHVTVYYNPRNPADACLIRGSAIPRAGYVAIVLIALAAVTMIVIGLLVLRRDAG